ncbi:MAG: hypothetical protein P8N76_03505 [Pirellulaceae bacterium]|nr:hypothetical protein [Pirellulaceae bacterium]
MAASKNKWQLRSPLSEPSRKPDREPTGESPFQPNPRKPLWQPRFGLGSMMLILLVAAMTAAIGRQLIQAVVSGTSSRVIFVMFVLVLPVILLIVMNLLRLGSNWFRRQPRRK